jgi:hypothetical protein
MQKHSLFIICIVLATAVHAQEKTKFIQKVAFEGSLGFSSLKSTTAPNTALDFMNYCEIKNFEDPSYLTIASHVWLKNKMEIDVEIGQDVHIYDFTPLFDLKFTSPLYKQLNFNLGINRKFISFYAIQPYYFNKYYAYPYYHQDQDPYNPQVLFGPYAGLNYSYDQNRLLFRADLNAGIHYNNQKIIHVNMKELTSNFIAENEFNLQSTASFWISPELYVAYALIDTKKFQLGCRVKGEYFVTKKGFNYELTEYKWTDSNPIVSQNKLPKHTINNVNVDFGIYVSFK